LYQFERRTLVEKLVVKDGPDKTDRCEKRRKPTREHVPEVGSIERLGLLW